MKLYATVTSERESNPAKKGGNKHVIIKLSTDNHEVATIVFDEHGFLSIHDKEKAKAVFSVVNLKLVDITGINQTQTKKHIHDWDRYGKCVDCGKWNHNEELKAKKQKGDDVRCRHGVNLKYDDCLNCDKGDE